MTEAAVHELPATLPGWLVVFLSVQRDWVSRDRLMTLFWPDAASAEAQHNLRVNLLRARQLLAGWGLAEGLQAERRRVRLSLATDVAELRAALAAGDTQRLLGLYAAHFLEGMAFAGFAAFQEWVEIERADLQNRWRDRLIAQLGQAQTAPAQTIDITRRLLGHDALDEAALAHHIEALAASGRQAQAAQDFGAYRDRLQRELGVAPPAALQALVNRLTPAGEPSAPAPLSAQAGEVVAPASKSAAPAPADAFIGRGLELAQLQAMLLQPDTRLLTLVGPGGVGKSRIARELASRLAGQFACGVCWIALGTAADADEALARLALQLGLPAMPALDLDRRLAHALAGPARLLVFDNGEAVAGLGLRLAALLPAGTLRCLVTSRSPLQVASERVFALQGLDMPEPGSRIADAAQARGYAALQLLESRARALDPGFDLMAQLDDCIALVRCVGGWPLAIEISAGLLARQSAADLVVELSQTLDSLAAANPPEHARHASVRASLALSWRLLPPPQRQALACLSLFKCPFSRAAALDITGCDASVLVALSQHLLVQAIGGGRYALHPLVAQFAAERLADQPGPLLRARRRHGRHFLRRLHQLGDRNKADGAAVAQAVEVDLEDFQTAWAWRVELPDPLPLAQAAHAWTHFCNVKGRAREVAALLESALAADHAEPVARGPLLLALANARYRCGDLDAAAALARDAVAVADAAQDAVVARIGRSQLALILVQRGQVTEAAALAQESLRRVRAAAADGELGSVANTCAIIARAQGDLGAAASLYQEAIAVHRRLGNQRGQALCLNNLGNVWRSADDLPQAQRCFEECLRLCEQHGIDSTRAFALGNLGAVALAMGRLEAARLFADRTLAEPAAEPAMLLGACSVHVGVAIGQRRLDDAAGFVRRLARLARATGLHSAMNEAIVCHARWLLAGGQMPAAAARLRFVAGSDKASASDRAEAGRVSAPLELDAQAWASAERQAQALDFDVLLEDAAQAGLATQPDV